MDSDRDYEPPPVGEVGVEKIDGMAGEAEMILDMVAAVFDHYIACDDPRARQAVIDFARKDATLRQLVMTWMFSVTRAWSEDKGANQPEWWNFEMVKNTHPGTAAVWRLTEPR
jgi:hypothetical protein